MVAGSNSPADTTFSHFERAGYVMGIEIERKFLVASDAWRAGVSKSKRVRQAYLRADEEASVRVRLVDGGGAFITIKSGSPGIGRHEFEYAIPPHDAEALFALRVGAVIEKVRHLVPVGAHTWEVDVFEGENRGLCLAEIELAHADEAFETPAWIGREVTADPRYYNALLAQQPFERWC